MSCVGLFVTWFVNQQPEREQEFRAGTPARLTLRGEVLGVDVNRSEMSIRLTFEPENDLLAPDGRSLRRNLLLVVNAASGQTERPLLAGHPPNPTDVTISIFGGEPADFPFDRHRAVLLLDLTDGPGENAQEVPFTLLLTSAVNGLGIDTTAGTHGSGFVEIDFLVTRSNASIGFALLVMAMMWGLTLGVYSLMIAIVFFDKRIEATIFSWLGAMLFAFPALRSAVPGAPPIGAAIDYFAFFWAETMVALCLLTILVTYIRRPLEAGASHRH